MNYRGALARYLRRIFYWDMTWTFTLLFFMVWNVSMIVEVRRLQAVASLQNQLYVATLLAPSHFTPYFLFSLVVGLGVYARRLRCQQMLLMLQSFGVSRWGILKALRWPIVGMGGLAFLFANILSPVLASKAHDVQVALLSEGKLVENNRVVWIKTKEGFIKAHFNPLTRSLNHVRQYEFNEQRLASIVRAENLFFENNETWKSPMGDRVDMEKDGKLSRVKSADFSVSMRLRPGTLEWITKRPKELQLGQMIKSLLDLKKLGMQVGFSWVYVWQKVLLPLQILLVSFALLYWLQVSPCAVFSTQQRVIVMSVLWAVGNVYFQYWLAGFGEKSSLFEGFCYAFVASFSCFVMWPLYRVLRVD